MPRLARSAALAVLGLLAVVLLAGCAGKSPADPSGADGGDGGDGGDGRDGAAPGGSSSASLGAPEWAVGQWWEWEVTFGTETRDETFCSIVVGAGGSSYTLATEKDGMAKEEAAFSHPLLGAVAKGSLAMDGWSGPDGAAWSLLSFPLAHGKTWTATMPNIAWDIVDGDTVDLAMTAHVTPPAAGEDPLVHLQGKSGEHTLVTGLYDPATGWFRELSFFDVDSGEEELEVGFRAVAAGMNYTGPVFEATANPLLDWFDGYGFTDIPTEGGQPFADPHPYVEFTMEGGEGHLLYGILVAEAAVGGRAVVFTDPNNNPRHVAVADPDGGGSAVWLDEPAIAGTWRIGSLGGGGYSVAAGALWEVVVTEGAL